MTDTANYDAAKEIYGSLLTRLQDEKGVHVETAIAALSAVAGEWLLRACHIDLSPYPQGGIVLADQINDSGPRLLGYLEQTLDELLVEHADDWSGKIPADHQPMRDPLKLAHELRPFAQEISGKYGLAESQSAYATCMALAFLIRDSQKVLEPAVSVVIASNVIVRASKSVPLN